MKNTFTKTKDEEVYMSLYIPHRGVAEVGAADPLKF